MKKKKTKKRKKKHSAWKERNKAIYIYTQKTV